MGILDSFEAADEAFRTKTVLIQDNATLLEHLHGLSNQNNINSGTQHRDIIRGLTINNILLQRHINSLQEHITTLDTKNTRLQWWVVVLAVAALIGTVAQTIGTGIQTYIAVKRYTLTQPLSPPIAALPQGLKGPRHLSSQAKSIVAKEAPPIGGTVLNSDS